MSDSKKELPTDGAAPEEWDSAIDAWEQNAFSDKHFDQEALEAHTAPPPPPDAEGAAETAAPSKEQPSRSDLAGLLDDPPNPAEQTVVAPEALRASLAESYDDDESTSIAIDLDALRAQSTRPTPLPPSEPEVPAEALPSDPPASGAIDLERTQIEGPGLAAPSAPESVTFLSSLDEDPLAAIDFATSAAAVEPRVSLDPEENAVDALLASSPPSSHESVPSERSLGAMFPVGGGPPSGPILVPTAHATSPIAGTLTVEFPLQRNLPVTGSEPSLADSDADRASGESALPDLSDNELTVTLSSSGAPKAVLPTPPAEDSEDELAALDALVESRAPSVPAPAPAEAEPIAAPPPRPIAPLPPLPIEVAISHARPSAAPPAPLPAMRGPLASLPMLDEAVPSAAGERTFDDEKPAAEWLANENRRGFAARAEWLADEARLLESPEAKARGLLAASELLAIAGDATRAEMLALEAEEFAPELEMVRRQVRAFAALVGDEPRVREGLDQESREASSEEARAHASFMLLRHARRQGERDVEQVLAAAARHQHQDEAALALLDDALEGHEGAAALARKSSFADAIGHLRRLFGYEPILDLPKLGESHDTSAVTVEDRWFGALRALHAVAEARAPGEDNTGIDEIRIGNAITALGALAEAIPELEGAVHWLVGTLGREHAAFRPRAAAALRTLPGKPGRDRMLAATLLDHGVAEIVANRTGNEDLAQLVDSATGFASEERAALSALAGRPFTYDAEDVLGAALGGLGRLGANPDQDADRVVGTSSNRIAWRAARRVAGDLPLASLEGALLAKDDSYFGSEHAVAARLLREEGRLEELADLLLRGQTLAERLASALLAEAAGRFERARTAYAGLERAEPRLLSAVRAAQELDSTPMPKGHSPAFAQSLLGAIEGSSGLVRQSLLFELFARDELAAEKLTASARELGLSQLHDLDKSTYLATFLGEDAARTTDRRTMLSYIDLRKAAVTDADERVLETVRELLLYVDAATAGGDEAENDAANAASRAEEAHRARPRDLALRELFEGLATELPADSAEYRVARAKEHTGVVRAALLHDAALLYEERGEAKAALSVLKQELTASSSKSGHDEREGSWLRAAVERLEIQSGESERLADQLMLVARESDDKGKRLEAYMRLADLDARGRGDSASALLWHRTILDEEPNHLPSLRYVEHALISGGRADELEPLASSIARVLAASDSRDGKPADTAGEASAHAELAARFRLRSPDAVWTQVRDLVELAFQQPTPSLWAIRTLNAHARHAHDDGAILKTTLALLARASAPADRATLLTRAAEAAARLGRADEAREHLEEAVLADSEDVIAWGLLVEAREATGDVAGAAEACESLARSSSVDAHRLVAYYEAGRLWLEAVGDEERAIASFEQAARIDAAHADLFERLSQLFAARGDQSQLANLIERRLADIQDEDERILLEVELARTLERLGQLSQAKATLERALSAKPDHTAALAVFADVSAREGDYPSAEDAWLRLARLLTNAAEQRHVYERLGELYTQHAVNLPRAEAAWKEVLRRAPENEQALHALVNVYRAQNDITRAVEVFEQYLRLAPDSDERQRRLIALARLYEDAQNTRKAEQVLEAARREFPTSVLPLRSLAEFYGRQRQIPAMNILLDRAAGDARRAIAAGRFTSAVFQTLGTAAELRKNADATRVVAATVAAFEGRASALEGATLRAADPRLDELLAPEILSPALRALLARTGDALDNASPLDLRSLGATHPSPALQPTANMLVQAGMQLGMQGLQVYVTPRLGRVCLPVGSSPPAILVGESLLTTQHDKARAFLVLRALKLVYMRASALVRTSATDLPVLVGAWVKVFNPSWVAPGLNAAAVAEMGRSVAAGLPAHYDPNFGVMALEAAAALGTQTANLGGATLTWANRAALLAVGDPSAALDAVAWGLGQDALPTEREARAAWIARTQDARELLAFSVSEPYLEARRRLGLG